MTSSFRAHRVVQPVDVEDDGLGPLVAGAQEELGFATAADSLLGRLHLSAAGRVQELVDLRRQQLRLPGGGRSDDTRPNTQ